MRKRHRLTFIRLFMLLAALAICATSCLASFEDSIEEDLSTEWHFYESADDAAGAGAVRTYRIGTRLDMTAFFIEEFAAARPDYTLTGWRFCQLPDSATYSTDASGLVTAATVTPSPAYLYAEWRLTADEEPVPDGCVRVYFYSEGRLYAALDVPAGIPLAAAMAQSENFPPERAGYVFAGWYRSDDGGKTLYDAAYNLDDTVGESVSLYAAWNDGATYTVTYYGRSGEVINTQSVREGTCPQSFTPSDEGGYQFRGWYADANGTEPVDPFSTPITQDTEYWSYWVRVCTITFHSAVPGEESSYSTEWTYDEGADGWIPNYYMFPEPENGYYFLGWAKTEGASELLSTDESFTITDDMDLYAVWTTEYYTFTFVNTYKPAQTVSKRVGKGAKLNLDSVLGWNTTLDSPAGYTSRCFAETADATSDFTWDAEATDDKTFYVLWGANLVCHENWYYDGVNEYRNWIFCLYGQPITEPDYTPYREGYTFDGWYMDADCTTPAAFPLTVASAGYDGYIHIYAHWTGKAHSAVTVTLQSLSASDGLSVDREETADGFVLTATGGFASYVWRIDGTLLESGTNSSYTLDASSLDAGTHYVTLAARDADGTLYGARAVITVEKE